VHEPEPEALANLPDEQSVQNELPEDANLPTGQVVQDVKPVVPA
jgi:hypothetical protein